jgi:hypothetical protein
MIEIYFDFWCPEKNRVRFEELMPFDEINDIYIVFF